MKKKFTHGDASERGTIRQITYTTGMKKGKQSKSTPISTSPAGTTRRSGTTSST